MAKIAKAKEGKKKSNPMLIDLKKFKSVKQLKGAKYNPRFITDSRLRALEGSLGSFGDLSGVVFNNSVDSGVLISGHQRLKSIEKWDSRIEIQQTSDKYGTVALGYIHATSAKGKTISIPLRIVNWSDKKVEFAANIAANAHGGEFDNKKLASLVEKLDLTTIKPALIGLDPLEIRGLQQTLSKQAIVEQEKRVGKTTGKMNGSTGEFKEYTTDEVGTALTCTCPRCGFKFEG
ncbi:hypothetical protein pEaSNUABM14_00051 [Erwinia phage pEa_SNUABM_14]|uniref:Uncharacterized protein n=1 Tax=Erwinia phage pEa_SNUABM_7 TaxID=2866695 RepID=A0AAE8BKI8_9CAUD|nr:ParB-like partition protein [Erwinia phage pEa_SNUABM_7]QYW03011.1 hypothetical protein pEaSNUABM13_00052 [Erwinia phage pEa_SNUABM_13]QYW03353.1 hypothetical protein pEaSNUABM34_00051 [Erwinia phage pEa_SNUABM_34]QYW03694.1 hypothetical protein pEaSNUABM45_00051 [Erwinia phage pEa_SNUABM_45]QYW04035.1 hypothetical protein pEaSNUABM46_00051 [Erwinia phage pEa_SNUABM_46]QYW04376.1 hypothetical protein pEaSNUABM14_00051 [Erwinia phage pEa_SNUABM_14]QYW05066.1 hypothetical protein pEaSNUABM21